MEQEKRGLYHLVLPDYALPAFCDGDTDYYGGQDEILEVLARYDKRSGEALAETARAYFAGMGDGRTEINGLWGVQQLLSPVELLGERELAPFLPWKHTNTNTWGFPCELKADRAEVRLQYLRDEEGRYLRCVRARFTGLCNWSGFAGRWRPLTTAFSSGCPGILADLADGRMVNRVGYSDRAFETLALLQEDMAAPAEVDFQGFFNDLFGDG